MSAPKRLLIAFLVVLPGLWLATGQIFQAPAEIFAIRPAMMQGTGILAIGAMSLALVLAMRPVRLEGLLGGLDKGYRLHKWLGITALVAAVIHWLWAQAPKWAVGWGLLDRPARNRVPVEPGTLEATLRSWRGFAESVGEWAFYAAAALILLALIRRFPYRRVFQVHRLLALAYLVLVFHAAVLFTFDQWVQPVGIVVALLLTAGTVSALLALFGRIGIRRRVAGRVSRLAHDPATHVLEVDLALSGNWPGHRAGQFAFVTFDAAEGPHPFTISSAWQGDGRLRFHVKALGDHTRALPARLTQGDPVTVEGPYGRFDFIDHQPAQLWVAGGIGITPFLARLEALAAAPERRPVDLVYCAAAPAPDFVARLQALATAAGVRLHVLASGRDGRLDAGRLAGLVPGWREASIWFCGPAGFGRSLRRGLARLGLARGRFHQEAFEMR
ncbi:MAG: ferric reductase [Tistrella sp.]|mgnify:FL=1|nr:ferric reductase-like transmembrane domain-containing protein [uncultured Tistrella sp.]MAM74728.1 ferric reductase [Tistrella sp.]